VDVTKFDGSDPTSWVTQMEHYLVAMEKNFPSRVYCLDTLCGRDL
jgi:hypothetical protein